MNFYKLFYWLTVADNFKSFFTVMIVIFTVISFVSSVTYFISKMISLDPNTYESTKKECIITATYAKKWIWWSMPFTILFWVLFIGTPDKKDAILIIAGGSTLNFLTTDSSSKQIPHELSHFLVSEIKNMAQEAEVELEINNKKEEVLKKAKEMSAEEIISLMKSDTAFKNILLN